MQPIIAYRGFWWPKENEGRIYLRLEGGEDVTIPVDSPSEFSAMMGMLRDQSGATWDEQQQVLGTPWQKPGV